MKVGHTNDRMPCILQAGALSGVHRGDRPECPPIQSRCTIKQGIKPVNLLLTCVVGCSGSPARPLEPDKNEDDSSQRH